MYYMNYTDMEKQAHKDKSDGSEISRRGLLNSAPLATVAASLGVLPEGSFADYAECAIMQSHSAQVAL